MAEGTCCRSARTEYAETDIRHSGTARTRPYGVDATSTSYEQHGWDIHALSTGQTGAADTYHRSWQTPGSAGTPGAQRRYAPPAHDQRRLTGMHRFLARDAPRDGRASPRACARGHLAAELAAGGLVETVRGQPVPDPGAV